MRYVLWLLTAGVLVWLVPLSEHVNLVILGLVVPILFLAVVQGKIRGEPFVRLILMLVVAGLVSMALPLPAWLVVVGAYLICNVDKAFDQVQLWITDLVVMLLLTGFLVGVLGMPVWISVPVSGFLAYLMGYVIFGSKQQLQQTRV